MVAILFNDATPFEQTDNTALTEDQIRNLAKIGGAVSEKTFKNTRVYRQWARTDNLIVTKRV